MNVTAPNKRRVLVCGGRYYNGDVDCLAQLSISILIHGDCKGADVKAARWAKSQGIHAAAVPALWETGGRSAGFQRNSAMLLLLPELLVAFPGGNGTEMMVKLCTQAGIPVWRPYG